MGSTTRAARSEARTLLGQIGLPELESQMAACSNWPPELLCLVESMIDDLGKDYGLVVTYQSEGQECVLAEEVAVVLFRAARELLINVAKHSGSQTAHLRLLWSGAELKLRVEDEGRGFDLPAQHNGGFGLFGTRERLEHVRGRMSIRSTPGSGTSVRLIVPLGAFP